MTEVGEINPAVKVGKVVRIQQERVKAAEQPFHLIDRLVGNCTNGEVAADYRKGIGGSVKTRIESGNAVLDQTWNFDKNGQVISISINRNFKNRANSPMASEMMLSRDEDGKFQVEKNALSRDLPEWENEFHTAKARIVAGPRPKFSLNPLNPNPK